MDMQNYTIPFANTGDREEFSINTDPSGKVSIEKGWTELYQLRPEEGGLFILRRVFNQMMKLVSTDTVTWKTQTFPNWIDDKGDGLPFAYPKNALVRATNGENYVSLEDDNTDNPIGSIKWKNSNTITGFPAFSASKSLQSFTGGVFTKLMCDTKAYDTTGDYDTINFRYTPKRAGKYRVTAQMQSLSVYTGASISIYKNGSHYSRLQGTTSGSLTDTMSGSLTLELNGTTDYIEAYGTWISSNTASSFFQAEYIVGV